MRANTLPKLMILLLLTVIFSCSKTEENVPLTTPTAEITVDKLVRKASLRNQEIPFRIIDESGNDVTTIATFYVDGEAIEGSIFSSPTIGTFEVYGVYTSEGVEVTTNTESFDVIIPKQKIAIEDYTGTWCGFCPRVLGAVQELEPHSDDLAIIAIHETANSFPDPMHFDQIQLLKDQFDINGLPAARINRTSSWNSPYNVDEVTSLIGQDSNMAIAINSELNNDELLVQLNVVYEDGSIAGDRLVVYLLEDGIVYDQINYLNEDTTSPFFNLGNPIPDFVHNHVLRKNLSSLFGDDIPATPALAEYITSFTFNIPSDYVIENLSVVAMVVSDDSTSRNVQKAHLNEDKPYQ